MTNDSYASVIVCTYNEEKHIQECVKSILESDPRIQEIIIVDDSSTDQTKQKTIELHDSRIRFFEKRGKNVARGKHTSIFIGAKLANYDNLIVIDADTCVIKISSMIDMLNDGADLVGGIISIKEDGRLLAHCESIEYDIDIKKARLWLFKEIHYINTVSGAFFGIKKNRLLEIHIPSSVVAEDMYLTQIGIIQKWKIMLCDSEATTFAIPGLHALFIQRCRWIFGGWTVIRATKRKVPLLEVAMICYRSLAIISGLFAGIHFSAHHLLLADIVLALYFLEEFYETHNIKDSFFMMIYRQINFISTLLFPIFGRKWKVIR